MVAVDPTRAIEVTASGEISALTATIVPVAGVTGVPVTVTVKVVVVGIEATANWPLYSA